MTPLSFLQIERFEAQGYLVLSDVVAAAQLLDLRHALEEEESTETESPYGILCHNTWKKRSAVQRLIPQLGKLAMTLLRTQRVWLFQDSVIWKTPRTQQDIAWHQDYSYWPLDRPEGIVLWTALDAVQEDGGCIEVLPGSQRQGERAPTDFSRAGQHSLDSSLPSPELEGAEQRIRIPVSAGSVIAMSPLLLHRSGANLTKQHRRAIAMTFITESVCWNTEHAPHPYPVFNSVQSGTPPRGNDFPEVTL